MIKSNYYPRIIIMNINWKTRFDFQQKQREREREKNQFNDKSIHLDDDGDKNHFDNHDLDNRIVAVGYHFDEYIAAVVGINVDQKQPNYDDYDDVDDDNYHHMIEHVNMLSPMIQSFDVFYVVDDDDDDVVVVVVVENFSIHEHDVMIVIVMMNRIIVIRFNILQRRCGCQCNLFVFDGGL